LKLTVTERVYHGQTVRYHLRLDEGHELIAVAADRIPRFAVGQGVTATWNPEDVWLIPDAEPAAGKEESKE
jgi:hypothetical protein